MEVRYCACNKLLLANKVATSSATWTASVERLMGVSWNQGGFADNANLRFDSSSILILNLCKSDLVSATDPYSTYEFRQSRKRGGNRGYRLPARFFIAEPEDDSPGPAARAVVSRTTNSGSTTCSSCNSEPGRLIRFSRISAAARPISRSGWRTVVRLGFW